MKVSAGTLLYRRAEGGDWEVLIVCPSGPAARFGYSIPKGLPDGDESLEATARRETREETGVDPGPLELLGFIDYTKSKKRIHCFAGEVPAEAAPTNASWETSVVKFVALKDAEKLLHVDQRAFVGMLRTKLLASAPR